MSKSYLFTLTEALKLKLGTNSINFNPTCNKASAFNQYGWNLSLTKEDLNTILLMLDDQIKSDYFNLPYIDTILYDHITPFKERLHLNCAILYKAIDITEVSILVNKFELALIVAYTDVLKNVKHAHHVAKAFNIDDALYLNNPNDKAKAVYDKVCDILAYVVDFDGLSKEQQDNIIAIATDRFDSLKNPFKTALVQRDIINFLFNEFVNYRIATSQLLYVAIPLHKLNLLPKHRVIFNLAYDSIDYEFNDQEIVVATLFDAYYHFQNCGINSQAILDADYVMPVNTPELTYDVPQNIFEVIKGSYPLYVRDGYMTTPYFGLLTHLEMTNRLIQNQNDINHIEGLINMMPSLRVFTW